MDPIIGRVGTDKKFDKLPSSTNKYLTICDQKHHDNHEQAQVESCLAHIY